MLYIQSNLFAFNVQLIERPFCMPISLSLIKWWDIRQNGHFTLTSIWRKKDKSTRESLIGKLLFESNIRYLMKWMEATQQRTKKKYKLKVPTANIPNMLTYAHFVSLKRKSIWKLPFDLNENQIFCTFFLHSTKKKHKHMWLHRYGGT